MSGSVVWVSDDEFLTQAYRAILQRELEDAARPGLLTELSEERLTRSELIARMVESDEFRRLRALDDAAHAGVLAARRGQPLRSLEAHAGTDERGVEIPWVVSRYQGEGHVLDLGSAFASPSYLGALTRLGADQLVGVDLAPMRVAGMETIQADVRALPFSAESFELVLCVSTLEHVGRDNRVYGLADEQSESGMRATLVELGRVLTPAGRILITVPCGDVEDHGWFVQLGQEDWRHVFANAQLAVREEETYVLTERGWSVTRSLPRTGIKYGARGPGASAVFCAELTPEAFTSG